MWGGRKQPKAIYSVCLCLVLMPVGKASGFLASPLEWSSKVLSKLYACVCVCFYNGSRSSFCGCMQAARPSSVCLLVLFFCFFLLFLFLKKKCHSNIIYHPWSHQISCGEHKWFICQRKQVRSVHICFSCLCAGLTVAVVQGFMSLSCEFNISGGPWGNFISSGTDFHFDLRMS